MVTPNGFMKSSYKISPGGMGSSSLPFPRLANGLVIIDDFDFIRFSVDPAEADSPLVIDPNAVLPCPVAPQGFEPVSGKFGEFFELHRRVQLFQFPPRDSLNELKPPHGDTLEQQRGFPCTKRANHDLGYYDTRHTSSIIPVAKM
jgi:hypothetical protein